MAQHAQERRQETPNHAQERRVCEELVQLANTNQANSAIVLNDSTRGDIALKVGDGDAAFLPVQIKTASGPCRARPNRWAYTSTKGYPHMPVVCVRMDKADGYVYCGTTLDERESNQLSIAPGYKNSERIVYGGGRYRRPLPGGPIPGLALFKGTMEEIIVYLRQEASRWELVSLHNARRDFAGWSYHIEMKTLDAFRNRFPGSYAYPRVQHGLSDLIMDNRALQFKPAYENGCTKSGFQAMICRKLNRRQQPYDVGDFDELVIVAWIDEVAHFWRIPSEVLQQHGCLRDRSNGVEGRVSIIVHSLTAGRQPTGRYNANVRPLPNAWTREYYHNP